MPTSRPRPLTLTDASIVLAVFALLSLGTIPAALVRTRESAERVKCASNLRQIGQAILVYANANKGNFPRTRYDGRGDNPTSYTGADAPNPFAPDGPDPNDVTAAMFLLVRTTEIDPECFTCPNAATGKPWDFGGKPRMEVSNFPGRQYIGYSYINPYPTQAAVAAGFKLNYTLTSDFAIAADINPGPPGVLVASPNSQRPQLAAANSPNHKGDGQNVLYADGHVEFQNTPFSGMLRTPAPPKSSYRDNIYTFGAGFGNSPSTGVNGPPVDAADSVLLPVAPEGPALPLLDSWSPRSAPWVWVAVAVLLAPVLWWLSRRRSRRRRTAP